MTKTLALAAVTSIALLLPLSACTAVADMTAKPAPAPAPTTTRPAPPPPTARPAPPPRAPRETTHTPAKKPRPTTTKTQKPATDLWGTQYAYVTSSRGNRVTFDLVAIFEGKKAQQACQEDGESEQGVWCADVYFRNRNTRLRWLGADPHGPYRILDEAGLPYTVSMTKFLRHARTTRTIVKFEIDGGRILTGEEVFQT
jgi:hypothetical protein